MLKASADNSKFSLYVFRNIPKYRILAAGGDGTVGWVLQCLDIAKQVNLPCRLFEIASGCGLLLCKFSTRV